MILTAKDNRPDLLDITTGKDTLIEGVTFKNSPKYHLNLADMLNLTVQNLVIHVDVTDEKDFLK